MQKPVVHFGSKSYQIAFAVWDSNQQVGLIQVYDEDGNPFIVESDGLAQNEQRQAVAGWAMRRAATDGFMKKFDEAIDVLKRA